MIRRLLVVIALLLVTVGPVSATPSYWFGSFIQTANTGATRYFSPQGGLNAQSAENAAYVVMPTGGTISSIKVLVSADPTNMSSSWTTTVRKNTADGSTACAIAAGSTSCTGTGDTAVSQGDLVAVAVTPANTPAAAQISWMIEFDGTTTAVSSLLGLAGTLATNDRWMPLSGERAVATAMASINIVIPAAGTVSNLCIQLNTTPSAGDQRDFTVFVGATTSSITVQFDSDDVGVECDNATSPVSVAAGDLVSVFSDSTNAPTSSLASVGLVYTPTVTGNFIIPGTTAANPNNGATSYTPLTGGSNTTVSDATIQSIASSAFTIKALYVQLASAPGAGNSWTFELREDGADASTPFTVAITDASKAGNASGTFTPATNGKLNTELVPASSPVSDQIQMSYLGNVTVASGGAARIFGGGLF